MTSNFDEVADLKVKFDALPEDKKAEARALYKKLEEEDAARQRKADEAREAARKEAALAAETNVTAAIRRLRSFHDANQTRTFVQEILREVCN